MKPGHIPSLYAHFPFCESKCHYCDFYSLGREKTQAGDPATFEKALRAEIERSGHLLAPKLDTIFLGGGTPSMTPPDQMAHALEPLWKFTSVTPQTEWTMEANPSSVNLESLREYRRQGVNRISMGVQALRDDLLLKLGRVHSRDAALQSLETIFESGFDNVSVDLLCGVPGQSIETLEEALARLTAFPITHLSCYLLTLPKTHRMFRDLPDEDEQLSHLLLIDRWMREQGFIHYEISNFAKPGRQARHNLTYWKGGSYLGIGPSAHSFDSEFEPTVKSESGHGKRWKNFSPLHKYASELAAGREAIEWTEVLTSAQTDLERWMLALRLDEGFPEEWLKSSGQKSRAAALEKEGLLEAHPERMAYKRLTARGFALSDQMIASLSG